METIGIIGFGSFVRLLTDLIAPHLPVLIHSRQDVSADMLPDNTRHGSLEEVAHCSAIIIATELASLNDICKQLAPLVQPQTIVMDVCSVKVKPSQILQQHLEGKCRLLATHPMFGPNSVADNPNTAKGFKLVWHELSGGPFPELEALFTDNLGLELLQMTPEDHDKQMAWVHGLTFFVGRGLVNMDLPNLTLDTGYYRKLLDLFELEKTHSIELFETVELGNPYAKQVRERFMQTLTELEAGLERKQL